MSIPPLRSLLPHVVARHTLDPSPAQLRRADGASIASQPSQDLRHPRTATPIRIALDDWRRANDLDKSILVRDLGDGDAGEECGRVAHVVQLDLLVDPGPGWCVLDVVALSWDRIFLFDLWPDEEAPVVPCERERKRAVGTKRGELLRWRRICPTATLPSLIVIYNTAGVQRDV